MKNSIEQIRHSLAHLLVAAVRELYPGAKNAIGPAIEYGFYQDFDLPKPITEADLPKIEQKMRELLPHWTKWTMKKVSLSEVEKEFAWNEYKVELAKEFASEGKDLTFYTCGRLVDLCGGGHSLQLSKIDPGSFKLERIAGAYWRGDDKNKQLTRIYGLAFVTKDELRKHLAMLEEAKKRDHKKLGLELDLFTFSELVGSGLPLFTPKGTLVRDLLDNFVWKLRQKHGYQRVDIPHISKKDLYEKSGHWDKFKDELFKIITREGHLLAMKPMNCPFHTQIYTRKPHSYRELPQRYANTTKVYRDEQSGELAGLSRVRSITQDDAHVFCRINQVKDEIQKIWNIVHDFYGSLELKLGLHLSLRDPNHPEKYLGNKEHWNEAEKILRETAKENKTPYIEALGDAAFYAPKLDFIATDSLDREWQVATIQLDVHMPESFDLHCTNEKGEKERIVMIHAAIMGSIERFISVLIEHYAGAFPIWLSPVQVTVLPISDKQNGWAKKVYEKLKENDIRVEINTDSETLGKKIREAEMQKIPYLLVIGEKETTTQAIAVRQRGRRLPDDKQDISQIKLEEFVKKIKEEIEHKKSQNPV